VRTAPDESLAPAPLRSPADRLARRVLRLPEHGPRGSAAQARSALRASLAFTTVRCLLMYIVLPFVAPAVGLASDVAPLVGLTINAIAVVCVVASIRRFFRADHKYRWHYGLFGSAVLVALVVLTVQDLASI
jgi:hypothetical protein